MERHHFEIELQALKNRLLNMGALVEERVHGAMQALMERNVERGGGHRAPATRRSTTCRSRSTTAA